MLWHRRRVLAIEISLLLAAPWIVASIWAWYRAPHTDDMPPSLADAARDRLWA